MSRQKIALLGLAQAVGTVLYVALVVVLLTLVADSFEGEDGEGQPVETLQAVTALVFFIVSACVSAAMVLGYPAVLALRQRIREAISLVAATVAWLVLMLAGLLIALQAS